MNNGSYPPITLFTKPWKSLASKDLVQLVKELGFDGVELPVRDGFQVEPSRVDLDLVRVADEFRSEGLKIYSVAGDIDEVTIKACGRASVPVLRTMLKIEPNISYRENVARFRSKCWNLADTLRDSKVRIGLQNHCDEYVSSAIGILQAIDPLDSEIVTAVLDLGHVGLEGELEEIAVDIVWERLAMVNLKNALRFRDGEDAQGAAQWRRTWVLGKEGFTSWPKVIQELNSRNYLGPICLTAEYKDDLGRALEGSSVIPPLSEDLNYLKQLLGEQKSRKDSET